jgi:hypothetical protein
MWMRTMFVIGFIPALALFLPVWTLYWRWHGYTLP